MLVVFIALVVANCICYYNAQAITNLLCGNGLIFEGEEVEQTLEHGDGVIQDISDEAVVLLKNENKTLPLSVEERKVNLFGWTSTDKGYVYTCGGSASATIIEEKKVSLQEGLENSGFAVNTELLNAYTAFMNKRLDKRELSDDTVTIVEPPRSFYTEELMQNARDFSDIAIVTFSRWGAEKMEIPFVQHRYNGSYQYDRSRTYLELSVEEESLLELVTENFEKVIVLINTCNAMELGFLDNSKIDAAMFVGTLGQSGTKAIGRILTGEVNPSGKLTDTYVYDHTTNPSYINVRRNGNDIGYLENIYVGYKWYETANEEKFWESKYAKNKWGVDGYEDVVQYPFGYGLSYTDFEWHVDEISVKNETVTNKWMKIHAEVTVTNIGNKSGKVVVQLYFSPPYDGADGGGIEKPSISLVSYGKTEMLDPNKSQTLEFDFVLYDLASYDCYDSNGNGAAVYELDAGKYHLKFMENAHKLASCADADITFDIPSTINYKLDPETKQIVKNRFTGSTAYADCPVDGSAAGYDMKWLSRADFEGTFPEEKIPEHTERDVVKAAINYVYTGYDSVSMPTTGKNSGMRLWKRADGSDATLDDLNGTGVNDLVLNEELVMELGKDYNSEKWEAFLDQITVDELCNLVECSGYGNDAMVSIGKANNRDYDGPSGFSRNYGSVGVDTSKWNGYPNETSVGCTWNNRLAYEMGKSIGAEGNVTGISGWYAPGVNLHRSPYNGRFAEYYSEDPVLSGYLAKYTIQGAKKANTYCYLKHFAVSEMGHNPRDLNVWVTEQALRETYLRAFEIPVKQAGANAVMSAFNHIGATWAGSCKPLLTDILRTEWGFRGVVVTDWSGGGGDMVPERGIRAGNDTWLNPNDNNANPIDRNNPVSIYLARKSAKNMVYTICNTYYCMKTENPDDEFIVTVGIRRVDKVFPWWIPLLVVMDVTVVGAMALTTFLMLRKKKLAPKVVSNDG